jgi:hypothetical protein
VVGSCERRDEPSGSGSSWFFCLLVGWLVSQLVS